MPPKRTPKLRSRPRPKTSKPVGRRQSQSRGTYHHGSLRTALLEAAMEVLDEQGVATLSLRECARRAGVSHGAPAHHFKDVSGLMNELKTICFEEFADAMTKARTAAGDTAFAQLVAIGGAYADYALGYPERFRLMFRTQNLPPTSRMSLADSLSYRHLLECIALTDKAGNGNGSMLREKTALAHSIVHGFVTLVLDTPNFQAFRQSPALAHDFLLRMLHLVDAAFIKRQ